MRADVRQLLVQRYGDLERVPREVSDFASELEALQAERRELEQRIAERTEQLVEANAVLEREIADRRVAEYALQANEKRYELLAEHSPAGIFHADAHGKTLYVNRAWMQITGVAFEAALGDGWQCAIHPRDRARKVLEWETFIANREPFKAGEFRLQRPDGAIIWAQAYAVAVFDLGGHVTGYVGSLSDITEVKEAETAIRESEEKYRTLFEQSADAIYISTPDGRLLDINPAGIALFGYESKEKLMAVDLAEDVYVDPEDRERLLSCLHRHGSVRDLEFEIRRRDGQCLTVLATASAVCDGDGEIRLIRGILRDVTETRALEARLRQSQKLEAVGRLAGGVAHDFNNILTVIVGYSDLLSLQVGPGRGEQQTIQEIKSAGQRAADLTRQLLAFSRRQVMQPEVLSLDELVADFQGLLGRLLTEEIELETDLASTGGAVKADPSQMEQVLMNLVVNAKEAMPGGGSLRICTGLVDVHPGSVDGLEPGSYVCLTVKDSGCGIDADAREQIFEPFYTSKQDQGGTGLGLATVYGIVGQSGGHITVDSAPGQGSTFRVFLPRVEPKPKSQPPIEPLADDPRGHETVLLVEDDAAVRAMIGNALRQNGYTVEDVANGEEALELLDRREAPDLVISDIIMPGLNGLDLSLQIRGRFPELPILLVSGYAGEQASSVVPGTELLPKPFTSLELAHKVRELLGARRPARAIA